MPCIVVATLGRQLTIMGSGTRIRQTHGKEEVGAALNLDHECHLQVVTAVARLMVNERGFSRVNMRRYGGKIT